jgi:hypothetical protein
MRVVCAPSDYGKCYVNNLNAYERINCHWQRELKRETHQGFPMFSSPHHLPEWLRRYLACRPGQVFHGDHPPVTLAGQYELFLRTIYKAILLLP